MAAAISQKGSGSEPRRREKYVAPGLTADGEALASTFVWAAVMGSIEPWVVRSDAPRQIQATLLRQPAQPDFLATGN
jgi:hypothetical protein